MNPVLIKNIKKFEDERGTFYESFKGSVFKEKYGIREEFVQDNHSVSRQGTIRGLHYQWDNPMGKLVRVVQGSIVDVIVDIRRGSESFGKIGRYELSEDNLHQLYVPPGFAHGFVCLSETAIVMYKCTAEYNKEGESGINPFDKFLGIDWGIKKEEAIVSEKDLNSKSFSSYSESPRFFI